MEGGDCCVDAKSWVAYKEMHMYAVELLRIGISSCAGDQFIGAVNISYCQNCLSEPQKWHVGV